MKTDVTRFRYGDEQHLDEALKRIFQYGQVYFLISMLPNWLTVQRFERQNSQLLNSARPFTVPWSSVL